MEGWIKLHRKVIENPIFSNAHLFQLYTYCLLKANHKDREIMFNGKLINIEAGQFITGRNVLSEAVGENSSTTYKRLKKLEQMKYLSLKSNNKNTLVTITNWESYQSTEEKVTTKEQQSNNKVTTKEQQSNTNKNVKTDKNVKTEKKNTYGVFKHIKLTDKEYEKLDADFRNTEELIKHLDEYIEMKGTKYKNHNLVIRNWVVDAVEEKKQRNNKSNSGGYDNGKENTRGTGSKNGDAGDEHDSRWGKLI